MVQEHSHGTNINNKNNDDDDSNVIRQMYLKSSHRCKAQIKYRRQQDKQEMKL